MDSLKRLKEAYQEARKQLGEDTELSNILVNTQKGDFTFIWDTQDKSAKE